MGFPPSSSVGRIAKNQWNLPDVPEVRIMPIATAKRGNLGEVGVPPTEVLPFSLVLLLLLLLLLLFFSFFCLLPRWKSEQEQE